MVEKISILTSVGISTAHTFYQASFDYNPEFRISSC
jgi:hypothetical protein